MKNLYFLSFIIWLSLSSPVRAEQNQNNQQETQTEVDPQEEQTLDSIFNNDRTDQENFLSNISYFSSQITPDEMLALSRSFRYEGAFIRNTMQMFTVNELADRENLNHIERLELLKYLLDMGFVPLSPYIDLIDYFQNQNNRTSSNQAFASIEDFNTLQERCRLRIWLGCDMSPISFVRLALFLNPHRREFESFALTYADLESTFTALGYHSEDFTYQDLTILGQFVR